MEKRIDTFHKDKLLVQEKLATVGEAQKPFNEMYRTAIRVLYNPLNLWKFGQFEVKRAVQKLVFTERLVYTRNNVYRTPEYSLPFKLLQNVCNQNLLMVPGTGKISNQLSDRLPRLEYYNKVTCAEESNLSERRIPTPELFETLAGWNDHLAPLFKDAA